MSKLNKLHLGCGKRYLPGFIHIDCNDFEHIDHNSMIDSLPMIDSNSVELIYASHCFEYFDQEQAPEVLKEWRRCLAVNGVLRLAVPDFDKLLEVYRDTDDMMKIIGPLFGRWPLKSGEVLFHKFVYTRKHLTKLLEENGFEKVEEWDWRKELPDGYDDYSRAYYPHMDFDNGMCISLNIQARKSEH